MNTHLNDATVVVVGGGVAGLTAACHLARAGVTVTVFEKAAELGGRAATENYDGYYFNRGAHALYHGGAAQRGLRELGIDFSARSPKQTLMLHAGRTHLAPASLVTLLRTDLLSAADKLDLTRVLTRLALAKPAQLGPISVQSWIHAATRRETVRQVMASIARTVCYTAALHLISAEVFVIQSQLSIKHPVLYVDGGWQTLVDGLRRAAEASGARIVSGTRVEAVAQQAGRVVGVELPDGGIVHADAVILATTPQAAGQLSNGHLQRIVASATPVQAACLDVALRRLPAPHNPVVFDAEAPRFLTVQSLVAHITPPGGALIHTLKYLDPTNPTDQHADESDLEAFLDTLQPGWRAELVKRIALPRITVVSWMPTVDQGGFAGRPAPTVPDLAGLYLAGDWVGSEGYLLDASMASARRAAQLVLEHVPAMVRDRERSGTLVQAA